MNLAAQISFMNPLKGPIYCTEHRDPVLGWDMQQTSALETAAAHAGEFPPGMGVLVSS